MAALQVSEHVEAGRDDGELEGELHDGQSYRTPAGPQAADRTSILQGAGRLPSNTRVKVLVTAHTWPSNATGEASSEVNK
jgi:hypothetical protein